MYFEKMKYNNLWINEHKNAVSMTIPLLLSKILSFKNPQQIPIYISISELYPNPEKDKVSARTPHKSPYAPPYIIPYFKDITTTKASSKSALAPNSSKLLNQVVCKLAIKTDNKTNPAFFNFITPRLLQALRKSFQNQPK